MKLRSYLFPAIVSAIVLVGFRGEERPQYGGALRVEIGASVSNLDTARTTLNAYERDAKTELIPLVFETLVALDGSGTPQPALAISWDHDATSRHWNFHLRPGIRFHDDAPLSAEIAAAALANPDMSWQISTSADAVSIETSDPTPDLPYLLAEPRHALVHRAGDGALAGTGPFKITSWDPGKHALFTFNSNYWSGRPFLDAVDLTMGNTSQTRMIDLQLDKADLVELPPEFVRRAADDKLRTTVSVTTKLIALVFQMDRRTVQDPRIREAVARSIDRTSIVNFILQKQGEAAGGLLPQWLSGTAFLFSAPADALATGKLSDEIKPAPALVLRYDSGDAIDQAIAERIAVNARGPGITITTRALPATQIGTDFDARLVRLQFASPEPRAALHDLLADLAPVSSKNAVPLPNPASAEEIYVRERLALDDYVVVPIVHLPQICGVGNRVRNWEIRAGSALGGWQLADVWVEGDAK
jgi:peptide/nickel transport system substrate-binding protein